MKTTLKCGLFKKREKNDFVSPELQVMFCMPNTESFGRTCSPIIIFSYYLQLFYGMPKKFVFFFYLSVLLFTLK